MWAPSAVSVAQIYAEKAAERARELKQQHSQCAHTLRRMAANAEPYAQVQIGKCSGTSAVLPDRSWAQTTEQSTKNQCNKCAAHFGHH